MTGDRKLREQNKPLKGNQVLNALRFCLCPPPSSQILSLTFPPPLGRSGAGSLASVVFTPSITFPALLLWFSPLSSSGGTSGLQPLLTLLPIVLSCPSHDLANGVQLRRCSSKDMCSLGVSPDTLLDKGPELTLILCSEPSHRSLTSVLHLIEV